VAAHRLTTKLGQFQVSFWFGGFVGLADEYALDFEWTSQGIASLLNAQNAQKVFLSGSVKGKFARQQNQQVTSAAEQTLSRRVRRPGLQLKSSEFPKNVPASDGQ